MSKMLEIVFEIVKAQLISWNCCYWFDIFVDCFFCLAIQRELDEEDKRIAAQQDQQRQK